MTQTQHTPAKVNARLGENNYGKAEVKLMKVKRGSERHEIRELAVRIAMTGARTPSGNRLRACRTRSGWSDPAEPCPRSSRCEWLRAQRRRWCKYRCRPLNRARAPACG